MLAAGPLAGAHRARRAPTCSPTRSRRKPLKKIAFNFFQYAITVAAAGAGAQAHDRSPARTTSRTSLPSDLPGVLLAAVDVLHRQHR